MSLQRVALNKQHSQVREMQTVEASPTAAIILKVIGNEITITN